MKTKVAAYCRVITKDDDQENSFENQKSYFEREIKNNDNYDFYGIYADRGITGTTLTNRPEFNRMLTDAGLDIENGYKIINKPKFNLIMTKNTSRFARNVSVDVILKALAQNKVYVYFLDLNKTTENTEDITYIQIFSTFDERDSRDKSKKTSFGMIEGAKKGNLLINGKIYGYKYIQHENRLEIIQDEANIIKRMFNLYNDNIGAFRISNILMKDGVVRRDGKPFTENNIRRIIENEKYCGRLIRQKYDTGVVFNKNRTPRKRSKEEQIIFESSDKVPSIVSVGEYEKARN